MLALENIRSVLVVKPSSLGDVVHTLPAVHFLKSSRPDLSIRWLVNPEWAPLLAGNPDLDGIIEFPRSQFRGLGAPLKLAAWMKNTDWPEFDLALDFQGLARSGLLAKFSGARQIHCLADAEMVSRWVAHRVVPSKRDIHAVRRYLKLVADLGVPVEGPLEFPLPGGEPPLALRDRPRSSLSHGSYKTYTTYTTHGAPPFLLLHPFSRGQRKSLAFAEIEALCAAMHPLQVVVVGRSEARLKLSANGVDLLNRTSISELIWLIRHAQFTVSVDSGPMHIAAAITDQLLGIHTWSDPRIVGPCNPKAWVWKNGALHPVESLETAAGLEGTQDFTASHLPAVVGFLKEHIGRI